MEIQNSIQNSSKWNLKNFKSKKFLRKKNSSNGTTVDLSEYLSPSIIIPVSTEKSTVFVGNILEKVAETNIAQKRKTRKHLLNTSVADEEYVAQKRRTVALPHSSDSCPTNHSPSLVRKKLTETTTAFPQQGKAGLKSDADPSNAATAFQRSSSDDSNDSLEDLGGAREKACEAATSRQSSSDNLDDGLEDMVGNREKACEAAASQKISPDYDISMSDKNVHSQLNTESNESKSVIPDRATPHDLMAEVAEELSDDSTNGFSTPPQQSDSEKDEEEDDVDESEEYTPYFSNTKCSSAVLIVETVRRSRRIDGRPLLPDITEPVSKIKSGACAAGNESIPGPSRDLPSPDITHFTARQSVNPPVTKRKRKLKPRKNTRKPKKARTNGTYSGRLGEKAEACSKHRFPYFSWEIKEQYGLVPVPSQRIPKLEIPDWYENLDKLLALKKWAMRVDRSCRSWDEEDGELTLFWPDYQLPHKGLSEQQMFVYMIRTGWVSILRGSVFIYNRAVAVSPGLIRLWFPEPLMPLEEKDESAPTEFKTKASIAYFIKKSHFSKIKSLFHKHYRILIPVTVEFIQATILGRFKKWPKRVPVPKIFQEKSTAEMRYKHIFTLEIRKGQGGVKDSFVLHDCLNFPGCEDGWDEFYVTVKRVVVTSLWKKLRMPTAEISEYVGKEGNLKEKQTNAIMNKITFTVPPTWFGYGVENSCAIHSLFAMEQVAKDHPNVSLHNSLAQSVLFTEKVHHFVNYKKRHEPNWERQSVGPFKSERLLQFFIDNHGAIDASVKELKDNENRKQLDAFTQSYCLDSPTYFYEPEFLESDNTTRYEYADYSEMNAVICDDK